MKNIRNLKFRIYSFEARCIGIISDGLKHGENKRTVLARLHGELARFRSTVRLSDIEYNRMWLMCVQLYNRIARMVRGKRTDSTEIYRAVRKLLPDLERFKNDLARSAEEKDKREYLNDLASKGIFYLCSEHGNCAEGHKAYQGRIYVSEAWRERCSDFAMIRRVGAYIRNHSVMSIEEVCDSPVWMVKRPNCRHYFKELDTEKVLHSSVRKLLRDNKMIYSRVGSQAYYMYRAYYERLKVLLELRKSCPCDELEADIRKTRKLMKKWLSRISG